MEEDGGGGEPWSNGGGKSTGEKRSGDRIPKGAGVGRNRNKLCNIAQFFAAEKAHRDGNH